MKFLDKFILIPIDRYERLLKASSEHKIPIKASNVPETTSQTHNSPNSVLDPQNTSPSNITNKSEQIEPRFNKPPINRKSVNKTYSQNNTTPPNQKKNLGHNTPSKKEESQVKPLLHPLNKIPPRPPGTPNKKRKGIFKWESLF